MLSASTNSLFMYYSCLFSCCGVALMASRVEALLGSAWLGGPFGQPCAVDLGGGEGPLLPAYVEGDVVTVDAGDAPPERLRAHAHLGEKTAEAFEVAGGNEGTLAPGRFDLEPVRLLERVEPVELQSEHLGGAFHVVHRHDGFVESFDTLKHPARPSRGTDIQSQHLITDGLQNLGS